MVLSETNAYYHQNRERKRLESIKQLQSIPGERRLSFASFLVHLNTESTIFGQISQLFIEKDNKLIEITVV